MADLGSLSLAWVRSPAYVDMTSRQIAMLALLCDERWVHSVRMIAMTLKVSKPVVTRMHCTMARLGLVERVADVDDRRSCFITATDAGRALRQAMREGVRHG